MRDVHGWTVTGENPARAAIHTDGARARALGGFNADERDRCEQLAGNGDRSKIDQRTSGTS
jgi:hypothetical protein